MVFAATSAIQMIAMHLRNDPVPPSLRGNVPIPQPLEAVILKCLAKKPEDRYASVTDLSKALDAARIQPWTEEQANAFWAARRQSAAAVPALAASERGALAPI